MEVMLFGCVLQSILKQVLTADLHLSPVYLSRVDLTEAYMRLWVRMEDVPSGRGHPPGGKEAAPYFRLYMERAQ